jgi:hypothetical protein
MIYSYQLGSGRCQGSVSQPARLGNHATTTQYQYNTSSYRIAPCSLSKPILVATASCVILSSAGSTQGDCESLGASPRGSPMGGQQGYRGSCCARSRELRSDGTVSREAVPPLTPWIPRRSGSGQGCRRHGRGRCGRKLRVGRLIRSGFDRPADPCISS